MDHYHRRHHHYNFDSLLFIINGLDNEVVKKNRPNQKKRKEIGSHPDEKM